MVKPRSSHGQVIALRLTFYLVKVKGTQEEVAACAQWFQSQPHLALYVCHIEIWVPVWGPRAFQSLDSVAMERRWILEAVGIYVPDRYHAAAGRATLDEIFRLIRTYLPTAQTLTLEGGHARNSPVVDYFPPIQDHTLRLRGQHLPVLDNVSTFVMRGAWNLMRDFHHWRALVRALPALAEWQCAYGQAHTAAYYIVILAQVPTRLRHLKVDMEGLTENSEAVHGEVYRWTGDLTLLCRVVGMATPKLVSFSYTGRVCWYFFDCMIKEAIRLEPDERTLTSLDLTVKGCCRQPKPPQSESTSPTQPSGIEHLEFPSAFHAMVIKAIECLSVLPQLKHVRIRYVDLASISIPLNPYFELVKDECTGLWSPEILKALSVHRPSARFVELEDGITVNRDENGRIVSARLPQARPRSIQAMTYSVVQAGLGL
jgi:hypothetical protein